jgi:hypothetical protein
MKIAALALFALSTITSVQAFEFKPGVYTVSCSSARARGVAGYNLKSVAVKGEGSHFKITGSVERLTCKQINERQGEFQHIAIGEYDTVLALQWNHFFKLPGDAATLTHVSTGVANFEIDVDLNQDFFSKRQFRALEEGKTVAKEVSLHYGHGYESSDPENVGTYSQSQGYYSLKIEVNKARNAGYDVKLNSTVFKSN